jgi:hypothetical protein
VPARHLKARWNVGKSRAPVLWRPRVIVPRIRRLPWAPSTVSRNAWDSLLNATPQPIRSFLCRTAVVSARAIYVLVCRHRIGSCEGPDLHIPFLGSTKKSPGLVTGAKFARNQPAPREWQGAGRLPRESTTDPMRGPQLVAYSAVECPARSDEAPVVIAFTDLLRTAELHLNFRPSEGRQPERRRRCRP